MLAAVTLNNDTHLGYETEGNEWNTPPNGSALDTIN